MTGTTARQWQGVVAFLGITLGALPLAQVLINGRSGLWRFVLGDDAGTLSYVVPAAVTVLAVLAIVLLERRSTRG